MFRRLSSVSGECYLGETRGTDGTQRPDCQHDTSCWCLHASATRKHRQVGVTYNTVHSETLLR
ncbi:hypothetical protein E2C01_006245 [Portunus trituberculatus]|uniref:Uncharacterized protein n=1 Tax=Portunus trituberculatus TaxID=210409 RepID=A0A5B7CUK9_PORTR|nr:hypothetical protein [Portunus trituberculatus]